MHRRSFCGEDKEGNQIQLLEGGIILNFTAKELMHLEDYLALEKSREKTLTFYAEQIQDQQIKTMLQQMTQKSQGNFQRMVKHVSGQNLQ